MIQRLRLSVNIPKSHMKLDFSLRQQAVVRTAGKSAYPHDFSNHNSNSSCLNVIAGASFHGLFFLHSYEDLGQGLI